MFIKPAGKVVFADDLLEKAFVSLAENSPLKKSIQKVIDKLKENAFCGENIPKRLIPKDYIQKYQIDNLWWYPLANAWRLVYSLSEEENIKVLAIIIDYYSHKEYERKFKY
jgi:Txe/YoeB family toxin of Txe-Axe toxin-antitoxin module